MPYIALKRVKFDKEYPAGALIPDVVVAPDMAKKLVVCGIIQSAAAEEHKEEEKENKQKSAGRTRKG